MIIDCISDLHGHYPKLEGGDLLIVAGDLTAADRPGELCDFYYWLDCQDYTKKVVIAGNHDNYFYACHSKMNPSIIPFGLVDTVYLCDSGTEFEWFETEDTKWGPRHLDGCRSLKLKIWGSPWSKRFKGMNPNCMAFTVDTEEELAEKWAMIPDDVDILVTHSPPKFLMDEVTNGAYPENVGSISLCNTIKNMNYKLHVFGHIHEGYGKEEIDRISDGHKFIMVNASHVNERYQPFNKPIRVQL